MDSHVALLPLQMQSPYLTHDQSLEVVQIFLNAAVACIAHTRELIPWVSTCFQTRHISQLKVNSENTASIYDDFCGDLATADKGSSAQEFRILRRGFDRRADCILDMIDGGVTAALRSGYLDAFQIIIAVDTSDPASTLESYTFSFVYEQDRLSGVNMATQASSAFSLGNVHRSFNTSIRALLRLLKDRPRLPRHRSFGVSLLYNNQCPGDYQPCGFVDARILRSEPIRGSWMDLWVENPVPNVSFRCGNRSVRVGAQSLHFAGHASRSRLQDAEMSAQLRNMQNTSSKEQQPESTESIPPTTHLHTGASVSSHEESDRLISAVSSKHGEYNAHAPAITIASLTTAFIPTQVTLQSGSISINPLAGLGVSSKNRRRRNVVASKLAELIVQARAMENSHGPRERLFDRLQLKNGRIRRLARTGPVVCDCRSEHETETMLLCELCGTRQHKFCYGYAGLRPGCLPEEHFCYSCLLLPREDAVCERMQDIVHMRLALFLLSRKPNAEIEIGRQFFESLFPHGYGDKIHICEKTIDRLTEEGYLNIKHKDTAVIMAIDNRHMTETADKYLDPLAGIIHHYRIVRDGDTYDSRKQEILKALAGYVGKRNFSFDDITNTSYDRLHARNNSDQEVIRWGFYASWKRKEVETLEGGPLRKKLSVCNEFVRIDKSTPTEIMSIDEALQQAVSEAEWDLRISSRLNA